MKISLHWLKELVDFPCTTAELAHRLTMAGLEVEAIDDEAARFEKIVVGFVKTRIKHPNADTLSVCGVDVGGESLQEIVCGAPNVDAGQKVAVALVGAKIGDFTIEKRKLRGIVSNGMICSERELGLGESHQGIMVLDDRAAVGQSFAEYYGTDVTFDLAITPNRADALSHIGVARDVAALFGTQLKRPAVHVTEGTTPVSSLATVEIADAQRCPRYVARVIRNVKIGPSPAWLVQRLARVGLRSINNVVDATNYVLMECGHPLHAFDYDKLAGHKIVVRTAIEGETFVTLDDKSRTLRAGTLLICDGERGVAIAGVMGGANAEITDATTNVLIESAYFDPSSIRNTSKYLGLSTDASYRFERGTDIDNAVYAADRATEMIRELAGGDVAAGRIDAYPAPMEPQEIAVRPARVNEVLGATIATSEMIQICGHLGFAPQPTRDDMFAITVPTWRPDMHEEIDVVEDIARIAGYHRFMPDTPHVTMRVPVGGGTSAHDATADIRAFLMANGFTEIVTNSLVDETTAKKYANDFVRLANPLSNELAIVRPHPLPQALATVALNMRHGTSDIRLFELSHSYHIVDPGAASVEERYTGTEWLTIVMAGKTAGAWDAKPRALDFYDMKGAVVRLFAQAALDNYRLIAYNSGENQVLTAQSASITLAGRTVGHFGQVLPAVLRTHDIDGDVYVAMIEAAPLKARGKQARYVAPPRFPWVVRDLALVAPEEKPAEEIEAAIKKAANSPLLRGLKLFDVFAGPALGAGNRSLAYSLTFGADDRTLRDEEIDAVVKRIVNELQQRHHLSIRA